MRTLDDPSKHVYFELIDDLVLGRIHPGSFTRQWMTSGLVRGGRDGEILKPVADSTDAEQAAFRNVTGRTSVEAFEVKAGLDRFVEEDAVPSASVRPAEVETATDNKQYRAGIEYTDVYAWLPYILIAFLIALGLGLVLASRQNPGADSVSDAAYAPAADAGAAAAAANAPAADAGAAAAAAAADAAAADVSAAVAAASRPAPSPSHAAARKGR